MPFSMIQLVLLAALPLTIATASSEGKVNKNYNISLHSKRDLLHHVCNSWCANHAAPWRHPNPNIMQKCNWLNQCAGCPQCSRSLESIEPTPAPTKPCLQWCENHDTPWTDPNPSVSQKCNWPKACAGCPQCSDTNEDHSPTPASTFAPTIESSIFTSHAPSSSNSLACNPWCANHDAPWTHPNPNNTQKCQWLDKCAGCPECADDSVAPTPASTLGSTIPPTLLTSSEPSSSTSPVCLSLCANHDAPWTHPNPNNMQKCQWLDKCAGCPECADDSVAPAPTMTSMPSFDQNSSPPKICLSWCENHEAPWTNPDPDVNQKCGWPFSCGGCPQCTTSDAPTPASTENTTGPSSPPLPQISHAPTILISNPPTTFSLSSPSQSPSQHLSSNPTSNTSKIPSIFSTTKPSNVHTAIPTLIASFIPTSTVSQLPSEISSKHPSAFPSSSPTSFPTMMVSNSPVIISSSSPSIKKSEQPTTFPSLDASTSPSEEPTMNPSSSPTNLPTMIISVIPTVSSSIKPSVVTSQVPSSEPTHQNSIEPSFAISSVPTVHSSLHPTMVTSILPTENGSTLPTNEPSMHPSFVPFSSPSFVRELESTSAPSITASQTPTSTPTQQNSLAPSLNSSGNPTLYLSFPPTTESSSKPSMRPFSAPSNVPTGSSLPTLVPSENPTPSPTKVCKSWCAKHPVPWTHPDPEVNQKCRWPFSCGGCPECKDDFESNPPTPSPTKACLPWCANHQVPWFDPNPAAPQKCGWPASCGGCQECVVTNSPSLLPSKHPTMSPSMHPTLISTGSPTSSPAETPTTHPTIEPSENPTQIPTYHPSDSPTKKPTRKPRPKPRPTPSPTENPTKTPTSTPSKVPSSSPTESPSQHFSENPSLDPSYHPSMIPSSIFTRNPSSNPSGSPISMPSMYPTESPTTIPSQPFTITTSMNTTFFVNLRANGKMDDETRIQFEETTLKHLKRLDVGTDGVEVSIKDAKVENQYESNSDTDEGIELLSEEEAIEETLKFLIRNGRASATSILVTEEDGNNRRLQDEGQPFLLVELTVQGEVSISSDHSGEYSYQTRVFEGLKQDLDEYASTLSEIPFFSEVKPKSSPKQSFSISTPVVAAATTMGVLMISLTILICGSMIVRKYPRAWSRNRRGEERNIAEIWPSFSSWQSGREDPENPRDIFRQERGMDMHEWSFTTHQHPPTSINISRQDSFSTISNYGFYQRDTDMFAIPKREIPTENVSANEEENYSTQGTKSFNPSVFKSSIQEDDENEDEEEREGIEKPRNIHERTSTDTSPTHNMESFSSSEHKPIKTAEKLPATPAATITKPAAGTAASASGSAVKTIPLGKANIGQSREADILSIVSSSPTKHTNQNESYKCIITVSAPPGPLGLILESSPDGPLVCQVKSDSPLLGLVEEGDVIMSIDGVDAQKMSVQLLTKFILETRDSGEQRVIKVIGSRSGALNVPDELMSL